MTEATLKLNSLGENVAYSNARGTMEQVYHLINMMPGTDPLNPTKGVGIQRWYYRLNNDATIRDVQQEIETQVTKYLNVQNLRVICKGVRTKKNNDYVLVIAMTYGLGSSFVMATNGEKTRLIR